MVHNNDENITYKLELNFEVKSLLISKENHFYFYYILDHEIRRSNVIAVSVPMEVPIKGPIPDRFFPYIVIHDESAPADARLEGKLIVRVLFDYL